MPWAMIGIAALVLAMVVAGTLAYTAAPTAPPPVTRVAPRPPPRTVPRTFQLPRPFDRFTADSTVGDVRALIGDRVAIALAGDDFVCPDTALIGYPGRAEVRFREHRLERLHIDVQLADDDATAEDRVGGILARVSGYGTPEVIRHRAVTDRAFTTTNQLIGLWTMGDLRRGKLTLSLLYTAAPRPNRSRYAVALSWRPPASERNAILATEIPGFRLWSQPPHAQFTSTTPNAHDHVARVSVAVTPCPCPPPTVQTRDGALGKAAADPANVFATEQLVVAGRAVTASYTLYWSQQANATSYSHAYGITLVGDTTRVDITTHPESDCAGTCKPLPFDRTNMAAAFTRAELRAATLAVATRLAPLVR
ncbi:MAG: hypothetical protein ABI867_06660 [Kofleriaceae bacterium]